MTLIPKHYPKKEDIYLNTRTFCTIGVILTLIVLQTIDEYIVRLTRSILVLVLWMRSTIFKVYIIRKILNNQNIFLIYQSVFNKILISVLLVDLNAFQFILIGMLMRHYTQKQNICVKCMFCKLGTMGERFPVLGYWWIVEEKRL